MAGQSEKEPNTQTTQHEHEAGYEEEFTHVLKELRRVAGLSQAQLAEKAGFDHSYVSRLESGDRGYSEETIEAFIRALDINEVQADRLRASAGLRGKGNTIFYAETEMLRINKLLTGSEITEEEKEEVRVLLYAIGALATRLTLTQESKE